MIRNGRTSTAVNAIQYLRQTRDNRYLALALRVIPAVIFLFSGITKLIGYEQSIDTIGSYKGLPSLVTVFSTSFLPWLELLVGAYLLLGLFLRWTAVAAGILSLCFIAVNGIGLYYGSASCPCFGATFHLLTYQALGIDIFLLLAAVYLFFTRQQFLSLDGFLSRRQKRQ